MADDGLSIDFSINPEVALEHLLAQGRIIEEVLGTAAKFAATRVDREFAGLGQAQLTNLIRRAQDAFATVRDQSGKTAKQIKADVANFNALFNQLTKAIGDVGELGFAIMTAASKKANKELTADSNARTKQLAAEADEARRIRLNAESVQTAAERTVAVELVKIRAEAERNADKVVTAARKATAEAAGKILVEQEREASRERLRLGEAAAAEAKQLALESAKTVGKIQRDALQDQRDAARRVLAEENADKRAALADTKRLADQQTEAARVAIRDRQNAERRGHLDQLEATRASNRLDLAEEKGHQFRKSEVVKTGLDLLRTQVRNFVIRRREDQRTADRLEVIEQERKAAESVSVKQSELRQIEQLSRASIARQAASAKIQTSASRGVAGAALGRSSIGLGLRNLAFIGGGIFSARSTIQIGEDFATTLSVVGTAANLTAEQLERVRKVSLDLGKDIALPGVSAKEGAQAIGLMAKSGINLEDTLTGAARAALTLSRAAGVDVEAAVKIVDDQINVFRLSGKDAQKTVDDLAGSIKIAGGASIPEMAQAFESASAVFQSTFQGAASGAENFRQLSAAIDVLGKNGVRGEEAGTGIRTALVRLTNPAAAGAKALTKVAAAAGVTGDVLFDAQGKTRQFKDVVDILAKGLKGFTTEEARASAFVDIFGSKSQIAARILSEQDDVFKEALKTLERSETVYDKVTGKIIAQGAAAKLAAAQNAGLKGATDALVSQLQTFQILLFEKVNKPAAVAVLALAKGLDTLANSKSFEAIRQGLKFVAIAAAGLLIAKVAGEAVQFLALSLKILAFSPFALISVGLLGIAFALGFFAIKNKEFGVELSKLFANLALLGPRLLKDLVQGDIGAAKNDLLAILREIANFPLVETIGATLALAGQTVRNVAVGLGHTIVAGVVLGVETAKELGPRILATVENAVRSAATSAVAIGKTILEKLGEGIQFAQDNQLGQKVGIAILGGLSEAGRLIAQVLTDDITIKVVAGVAAGLAAGAIVIVGAFLKGFIEGLVQNRGEIASALSDIFVFAVNLALPALKDAFVKSPVWAQILLFLGGLFVGAKIFAGVAQALGGLRANIKSTTLAMRGDFLGANLAVARFNASLKTEAASSVDGLGRRLPALGLGIRRGIIDPFNSVRTSVSRAATSLKTFEQNFLTLGRRGSQDLQAPIKALGQLSLPVTGGPAVSTRSSQNAPLVATQPLGAQQPQGQLQLFPTGQLDANQAAQTKRNFDIATRATQVMVDEQTKADRVARGLATATLIAGAAMTAYAVATQTGAVRTISLIGTIGTIVSAFAVGGPVAGGFAVAAAAVGLALGHNAKKAAEAAAGVKRYIEVLKEATVEAKRQKLLGDFQQLFEDNDKAATAFVEKLHGNFGTLTDAIFESRDAAIAYKDQLLDLATADALAGRGSFAKDAIFNFKQMTDNGVTAAAATAEVRRQIETSAGFDFIDRQIEGYATALVKQDLLKKAIGNSTDEQDKLTKLAQLDRDARIEALDTQRKLFDLIAGNEQGVIGLALGLESFSKQSADIAKAPADEQPRLRLELEKTARTLADEFVGNVDDAITAGEKIGIGPVEAVGLYRAALEDKLINGLKLSKTEADTLLATIDQFANKRIQAEIDIKVNLDTEAAKAKLRQEFGVIGVGGKLDKTGAIIDFGGAAAGAIIRSEQIIRVGEGNKPEVIIPLTDPKRAAQLAAQSGLLDILAQDSGASLQRAALASVTNEVLRAEVTVRSNTALAAAGAGEAVAAPVTQTAPPPPPPVVLPPPAPVPPAVLALPIEIRDALARDVAALNALAEAATKAAASMAGAAADTVAVVADAVAAATPLDTTPPKPARVIPPLPVSPNAIGAQGPTEILTTQNAIAARGAGELAARPVGGLDAVARRQGKPIAGPAPTPPPPIVLPVRLDVSAAQVAIDELLKRLGGTVPGAAAGAIIRKHQFIEVGEGDKPEVIIPLTDPAQALALASESGLLDILRNQFQELEAQRQQAFIPPAGDLAKLFAGGFNLTEQNVFDLVQSAIRPPVTQEFHKEIGSGIKPAEPEKFASDIVDRFFDAFETQFRNLGGGAKDARNLRLRLQFLPDVTDFEDALTRSIPGQPTLDDILGPIGASLKDKFKGAQAAAQASNLGIISAGGQIIDLGGAQAAPTTGFNQNDFNNPSLTEVGRPTAEILAEMVRAQEDKIGQAVEGGMTAAFEGSLLQQAFVDAVSPPATGFGPGDTANPNQVDDRRNQDTQTGGQFWPQVGFGVDVVKKWIKDHLGGDIGQLILGQLLKKNVGFGVGAAGATAATGLQFETDPKAKANNDIIASKIPKFGLGNQPGPTIDEITNQATAVGKAAADAASTAFFNDFGDTLADDGKIAGPAITMADGFGAAVLGAASAFDDLELDMIKRAKDLGKQIGDDITFGAFIAAQAGLLAQPVTINPEVGPFEDSGVFLDGMLAFLQDQGVTLGLDLAQTLGAQLEHGLANTTIGPIELQLDTSAAQAKIDALLAQIGVGGGALGGAFGAAFGQNITGAARGRIIDHDQIIRVGERGHKEVIIPLEDPDRAFALMVASGLDKLVAGRDRTVSVAAPAPGRDGPLIGEMHVHEVAGDPTATGIIAGRHIASRIQGALV